MQIDWYPKAAADFEFFQKNKAKTAAKIERLLVDIVRDSYRGLGKPEPLKYEHSGWWSRRIDDEHRLVYKVEKNRIIVMKCRFHYSKD